MTSRIPVGISACLIGENVRFDGGHKRLAFAMDELAPFVAFTAVWPEMAIGLPAPRPALRLVQNPHSHIALRNSKEGSTMDHTASMEAFAGQRVRQLAELCGYIAKRHYFDNSQICSFPSSQMKCTIDDIDTHILCCI